VSAPLPPRAARHHSPALLPDEKFRWRSPEISRIEAFSDAVFAFAVTLLVVSLEVPRNFEELRHSIAGFIPFAISFGMLVWIWYTQHIFFRRYGLQDVYSITLNLILLFVVLFYIYPLKFLFGLLVNAFSGAAVPMTLADGTAGFGLRAAGGTVEPVIAFRDISALMAIYAAGFIAIWAIFALLNYHAYRSRQKLELTPLEAFDTMMTVRENALVAAIGVVSLIIALTGIAPPGFAGWTYALIGPVMGIHGYLSRKQRERTLGEG
jgi:uncharacterized membrane protein